MVLWLLWCYGCCAGGPEHLILEIDGPYECVVIYALLRFTFAIAVFVLKTVDFIDTFTISVI